MAGGGPGGGESLSTLNIYSGLQTQQFSIANTQNNILLISVVEVDILWQIPEKKITSSESFLHIYNHK